MYIAIIPDFLNTNYTAATRKEAVANILEAYPEYSEGEVSTFTEEEWAEWPNAHLYND